MPGETGIGREKKAYASQVWHNDRDPIADFCVKRQGKTGIVQENKTYASQVWPNDRDPIAGFCVGNEKRENRLKYMSIVKAS